jgi:SAM-dependent methyltransferase
MTPSDPTEIVERGYDAVADAYAAWSATFHSPVLTWARRFADLVQPGARVLELGCGGNNPATALLVERYDYTGVDLSQAQLERARQAFPDATFIHADVTRLELPQGHFDGIASFFMLGHIPRDEQAGLLRAIHGWLKPGGRLVTTIATADEPDTIADWFGEPMLFSSFDEAHDREMLLDAGFVLDEARVVPFEEPGHGLTRFMWVLARA